jgi:hypothetical protein
MRPRSSHRRRRPRDHPTHLLRPPPKAMMTIAEPELMAELRACASLSTVLRSIDDALLENARDLSGCIDRASLAAGHGCPPSTKPTRIGWNLF